MKLEKIYELYFKDVYSYILSLSGDEDIAQEITGETFYKALKKIDTFRGECDMRVWLCQIAKYSYFSYLKRTKRIEYLDEEQICNIPDPGMALEEILIQREAAADIRKVLHTIAEPYKEVFMWRTFADLSFRQIGQIFGKSENWACVTYHRAKVKILKGLEGNSNENKTGRSVWACAHTAGAGDRGTCILYRMHRSHPGWGAHSGGSRGAGKAVWGTSHQA